MLNKIFLTLILLFCTEATAASMNEKECINSVIIDGMKVELSLTSDIIVDKKTNKLVESEFNSEKQKKIVPRLALNFTAIDKDIQWQEYLYGFGTNLSYMNDKKFRSLLVPSSRPIVSERLIRVDVLKKGMNKTWFYSLMLVNFSELFENNGFDITFSASGRLRDIKTMAPNPEVTNIYEGDKNIWQAPFRLCLKAKWRYK